jgi:uncharacterized protein
MASSNQDGKQGKPSGRQGGSQPGSSNRGFASMDPERQREIASQGGKAAHESGNAHEFNSEEARAAGKRSHGGQGGGGGSAGSSRGSGSSGGSSGGESGGSSGAERGGTSQQDSSQAGKPGHGTDDK